MPLSTYCVLPFFSLIALLVRQPASCRTPTVRPGPMIDFLSSHLPFGPSLHELVDPASCRAAATSAPRRARATRAGRRRIPSSASTSAPSIRTSAQPPIVVGQRTSARLVLPSCAYEDQRGPPPRDARHRLLVVPDVAAIDLGGQLHVRRVVRGRAPAARARRAGRPGASRGTRAVAAGSVQPSCFAAASVVGGDQIRRARSRSGFVVAARPRASPAGSSMRPSTACGPLPAVPSSIKPVASTTRSRSTRSANRKSSSRGSVASAARVSGSRRPFGIRKLRRWNCSTAWPNAHEKVPSIVLVGEQAFALEDLLRGDDAGVELVGGLPPRVDVAELAVGRERRVVGELALDAHALEDHREQVALAVRVFDEPRELFAVRPGELRERRGVDLRVTRVARGLGEALAHDRERRHDAVELGEADVRRQRLAVEILLAREREVARPEVRRAAVGLDREQHRRPRVAQIDDGRRRGHAARRRLARARDRTPRPVRRRRHGRSGACSPARRARDSRPDGDPRSCIAAITDPDASSTRWYITSSIAHDRRRVEKLSGRRTTELSGRRTHDVAAAERQMHRLGLRDVAGGALHGQRVGLVALQRSGARSRRGAAERVRGQIEDGHRFTDADGLAGVRVVAGRNARAGRRRSPRASRP